MYTVDFYAGDALFEGVPANVLHRMRPFDENTKIRAIIITSTPITPRKLLHYGAGWNNRSMIMGTDVVKEPNLCLTFAEASEDPEYKKFLGVLHATPVPGLPVARDAHVSGGKESEETHVVPVEIHLKIYQELLHLIAADAVVDLRLGDLELPYSCLLDGTPYGFVSMREAQVSLWEHCLGVKAFEAYKGGELSFKSIGAADLGDKIKTGVESNVEKHLSEGELKLPDELILPRGDGSVGTRVLTKYFTYELFAK